MCLSDRSLKQLAGKETVPDIFICCHLINKKVFDVFCQYNNQCCKLCLNYESESECESLTYESEYESKFSKKYFYESEFKSEFLMHESEYESEFRKKKSTSPSMSPSPQVINKFAFLEKKSECQINNSRS